MLAPLPARRSTRAFAVVCALAMAVACGKDSPTGDGQVTVARMDVAAGDAQTGTVGAELATPIAVKVLDDNGKPVKGQLVNFVVVSGGGSMFAGAATSDANGEARERWTLGPTAGVQRAEVRAVDQATGTPIVFARFTATARAGAAATAARASGDGQAGVAGASLGTPLVVKVADRYDNPVAGAAVTWTAAAGTIVGDAATDSTGTAHATWTLGTAAGTQQASATVAGVAAPVAFSATVGAAAAAHVTAVSGDGQSATIEAALGAPLVVKVTDAYGNAVPNASVAWAATAGGTLLPNAAATDASGQASARWTLGAGEGAQSATATVAGAPAATFGAMATPAPVTSVSVALNASTLTPGQSTQAAATLRDAKGRTLSGRSVTWSVSGTSGAATVDNGGRVTATAEGSVTVTATAEGVSGSAALTVQPVPVASVSVTLTATSVTVGDTTQATAVAKDASGATIAGRSVTWTSSDTGVATVSAAGRVIAVRAGSATVMATVSGVVGSTGLTVRALPVSAVRISSGDGQSAARSTELPLPVVVRATDARGQPVAGVLVNFVPSVGDGRVFAGSASTNVDGFASERWTLGSGPVQKLDVRGIDPSTGSNVVWTTFTANVLAGPPATVSIVSGNNQLVYNSGTRTVGAPLVVLVKDAGGMPVPNATVTWTVTTGGGTVTPATTTTDGAGQSSTSGWSLGTTEGTNNNTLRASSGSATPAGFVASLLPKSSWTAMASPTTQTLTKVWGLSATDVWAVGTGGAIVHFDGTSWAAVASPTTSDLTRVYGSGPSDLYAAGGPRGNPLLHYDGTSWSVVTAPAKPAWAFDFWVETPTLAFANSYAVNRPPGDSVMQWNGTTWTTVLRGLPGAEYFYGVPGRVYLKSDVSGGWVFNGSSWAATSEVGPRTVAVGGSGPGDLWFSSNTSGSCCTIVHPAGPNSPARTINYTNLYTTDFWETSDGVTFAAIGPTAGTWRFAPGALSQTTEAITATSFWGASDAALFAVGGGGKIWRYVP